VKDPCWVLLCKRTNDPKLAHVEWLLEGEGIDTRRNSQSFHAPILEVRDSQIDRAWELLGPIDEIDDDDLRYSDAERIRDEARADSAPPRGYR
jgi:hypothetical protein